MKKLLVVLLSVLMLMTLCACGSDKETGDDSVDSNTIKIGGSGPTTGEYAQYGLAVQYGAQVAVNEINEKAGENGLKLELKFLDDKGDGEEANKAYAQLTDWGMQVSMLCTTTGSSLAVADSYNDAGVFAMTPSGSAEDIIAGKDYVYRMCFADPEQGTTAADYIAEHKLATKVAAFVQSDSDYSVGVYDAFVKEAAVKGLEIVSTYSFTSDNATDFTTGVSDAQSKGAELVFLPLYYENDTKIVMACKNANYSPVFFGVDGFDGALEQEGVDVSMFEGFYYLTPFAYTATDDATVSFVSKFNALAGNNPNQFAADAYDVVYAIYNALVEAGATADMSAQDMGELLCKTFQGGFTYSGLTGSNMTWNENGAVVKVPLAFQVKDGKLTAAE